MIYWLNGNSPARDNNKYTTVTDWLCGNGNG